MSARQLWHTEFRISSEAAEDFGTGYMKQYVRENAESMLSREGLRKCPVPRW